MIIGVYPVLTQTTQIFEQQEMRNKPYEFRNPIRSFQEPEGQSNQVENCGKPNDFVHHQFYQTWVVNNLSQPIQFSKRVGSVSKPCTPGEHQNSW